ncbi:unnamed protein product [Adineta ricciae]|uniref:Uncharacterized protein n=1 Tax=Adineta ricciae TaxID=249248 RepID=A0A815FXV8_ADIRI|nr:unnamed protein product [Adineta ricciae]
MALACVTTVIGVIHCHVNGWSFNETYFFEIRLVLSVTGFLLIEQLLITDGTIVPLNRLRIIYAFAAAIALIVFGIGAAITANRLSNDYRYQSHYHNAVVAAVIAFIGAVIYLGEAIARNRKGAII